MINSIKMLNKTEHQFNYLKELTRDNQVRNLTRKLMKGIIFKPGINILIGENGCGKSTVLNIIRSSNRLEHSFIPKLDFLPIATVEDLTEIYSNFEIKQDFTYFTANLYRMSEDTHKLASNDLSNTGEVTQFMDIHERSKGQNVLGDISQLWHQIFEKSSECYPVMWHLKNISNKVDCSELFKLMNKNQVASDNMRVTILMDEPDTGLDIDNLNEIYEILSNDRDDTQLIVSIHNPMLIYKLSKLDYVNIIEMSDGYLEKIKKFVEG